MKKSMRASGISIAVVALGLTLADCGSETKTEATSETTTEAAPTTSAQASGGNYTIVDYIKDKASWKRRSSVAIPGHPPSTCRSRQVEKTPAPAPRNGPGARSSTPTRQWRTTRRPSPRSLTKLTGNVDPAKILEFAPGELKNLPEFQGEGGGGTSTLGGFDAYQIGGSYMRDGVKHMISQKTVVISGQDGLYVLQLNADGLEDQMGPQTEAKAAIDEQTTITP